MKFSKDNYNFLQENFQSFGLFRPQSQAEAGEKDSKKILSGWLSAKSWKILILKLKLRDVISRVKRSSLVGTAWDNLEFYTIFIFLLKIASSIKFLWTV